MSRPPKVNSDGQKELDKAQEKFDQFNDQVAGFNPLDAKAPVAETEPQTKMSQREIRNAEVPYIKPIRSVARTNFKNDRIDSRSYFDEKHRPLHDRDWEYVKCIVENNEIKGEDVEVWTAKWGCDPAHFWKVPVNKPVMIPRLLAEQLASCKYHRLRTEDRPVEQGQLGTITGALVVDQTVHRIDARPVGFGF